MRAALGRSERKGADVMAIEATSTDDRDQRINYGCGTRSENLVNFGFSGFCPGKIGLVTVSESAGERGLTQGTPWDVVGAQGKLSCVLLRWGLLRLPSWVLCPFSGIIRRPPDNLDR